ncbi:MAG: phage tail protein [Eubacteriales bacterium]|nr:phage tail protein [Eubacteriales bacterium]
MQIYKVTTKSGPLHLRSGTETNYKILGKYKKGSEVIVLNKTTSSWYEVTCPDSRHGYMSSDYLTFQRTEQQSIQTNVGFRNEVIEARQLRDQPFRIYRVVPELSKVTVYARHVFYDLLDNMIKKLEPSSSAVGASVAQNISSSCLSAHDFTFYSDLTSTAEEVSFENVNPVEAMLGEGGMAEKYGAELARDWFDVFLVKRVGHDTDVQIREKKNLTGISYDVDETDVVTRIMPTGEDADGNLLYLPELYIDSPNINAYTHPKWIHLAVSEAREVAEGDDYKSLTECYSDMRKAALAEYEKGCDLPTVTLKVDFVNCPDAEEYRQYSALSDIFLGDAVRVIALRVGVEVSMRMTQYTYDCLTKEYTSVTLGTVSDALEGSLISARQLASGSITGSKLAINSVGAGQLQNGSVGSLQIKNAAIGSAHIQDASIVRAHIAEALIDVLNVNALTAVTAKIQELVAGSITTNELYASIAAIATAQITTANIISADIQWASIEALAAATAQIAKAQITTATIQEASIDWAAITTLTAAFSAIVNASIGSADIDWAHIKDLTTDTAIITQGVAGELYISKLAVTEANLVSLTVGELVVRGADGHFYSVSVDDSGNVVSTLKQVGNGDVADVSINAGEKLIEGSVTAATLNAQDIFANNAIIKSLITTCIAAFAIYLGPMDPYLGRTLRFVFSFHVPILLFVSGCLHAVLLMIIGMKALFSLERQVVRTATHCLRSSSASRPARPSRPPATQTTAGRRPARMSSAALRPIT